MYRLFCRLHFPTHLDSTPADLELIIFSKQDSNIKHGSRWSRRHAVYSGSEKVFDTNPTSPTMNYCGCHERIFPNHLLLPSGHVFPLQLRPVAFSMGWLKHFPKVKVSKASGNATFSKLRLKETPKVMCCKPLLIFADIIRWWWWLCVARRGNDMEMEDQTKLLNGDVKPRWT